MRGRVHARRTLKGLVADLRNDMKVFAHYMGNEKDWNLSEDGLHEEGFRTRTVV